MKFNASQKAGGPEKEREMAAAETRTSVHSAVDQTLHQVSLELNPKAGHRLSADLIHYDEQGRPVISVINLDTREHWHLVVQALPLAKQ
jgi:hypothetical protein